MATAAKFPTAVLTLANLGAEFPNFPEATLSGAHNAAVTTITLSAAVPAAWPTTGGWVTIDSEIIQYTGVSGSTLTVCTRASQSTTATTHADQAKVGLYLTAATLNQMIADLISVESTLGANFNRTKQAAIGTRTGGDLTTASGSFVDATDVTATLVLPTGTSGKVLINVTGTHKNDGANSNLFEIFIDGAAVAFNNYGPLVAGVDTGLAMTWIATGLSAASHTFKLQWTRTAGTATLYGGTTGLKTTQITAVEL